MSKQRSHTNLLNIAISLAGVLGIGSLIASPAFSQTNSAYRSYRTPNGDVINIITPSTVNSPNGQQITTTNGTVTTTNGFTATPNGSITTNGTRTTNGLSISSDGQRITTPNGSVSSSTGFIAYPDGSFSTPGGIRITSDGTIISPSSGVITPNGNPRYSP